MRWIGEALDVRDVRPFQAIVYLAYMVAGVQSLALGAPPNAVAQALGPDVAFAWILLIILCPALTLLGIWREQHPFGLHMQAAGDSGVTFATASYVVAVIAATWAERATFAAWMAASLTLCAALMTYRDIRRIRFVRTVARRIDRGAQ